MPYIKYWGVFCYFLPAVSMTQYFYREGKLIWLLSFMIDLWTIVCLTINCYKGSIYSPDVHVNYIINLIHHVKSVHTVCEESLLYIKNRTRLLRSLLLLWFFFYEQKAQIVRHTHVYSKARRTLKLNHRWIIINSYILHAAA